MKKLVLFSALLLSSSLIFAQAPTSSATAASKPDAKRIGMAPQGGPAGSGAHYNMGPPAMSPADFRMACDAISRQPFDSDKMRIAQQILGGHYLTSLQVRDMAMLFTFESYRVDFAKAAYLHVVDPQNFYVVNDAFTFSSSIASVVEYTNSVGFSGGGTWTGTNGGWNGGGGHGHGHGGGGHGSGGGHGYGNNAYHGGGGASCGSGNGMTYSGSVVTVPAVPMCGGCSGYHAMNIVCEGEFRSISAAIDNRTFESDKILVAKQAIGGKLVSADQVRRIMGLFTFESTKLEFAKWAYRSTVDPQNYYIVNDAFTFSSSIRELDMFIRHS